MAFPQYIEVAAELQEDDFSCVPVCISMVLTYVKQSNPNSHVPANGVREIALAMGTDELGTPLDGVEGLNKLLEKSLPSVEFEYKFGCTLSDIEKSLEGGLPVIAWLKMPYSHSIVVTGIDKEKLAVYYNDPQKGKKQMEMSKFLSAWESLDKVLIKVKIGEKMQRRMSDYIGKEGDTAV